MIIYNRSSLPDQEIRKLMNFATSVVDDREVLVEVVDSNDRCGWSGCAWDIGTNRPDRYASSLPAKYINRYWSKGRSTCRYFVVLRVPVAEARTRKWSFREKLMNQKYPEGIQVDTWHDNFILLCAHEFRHVWQFIRNKRLRAHGQKEKPCTEIDAHNHAIGAYNKWREMTGRQPIKAEKIQRYAKQETLVA